MHIATWIVILGLGIPAYAYLGYPLLLFVLAAFVQMGRDVYYLLYRTERRTRAEESALRQHTDGRLQRGGRHRAHPLEPCRAGLPARPHRDTGRLGRQH